MSVLYIVATPIGNLEDITLRALRILSEVEIIACEDTRHTLILLSKYNIKKKTISCHQHNEEESAKGILKLLDEGKDIAFCSDAGTPALSDPGSRLVEYIRSNSSHGIVPIPGVSALTALVSVSGNIGKSFTFEGFLSPKSGRRKKRLSELLERNEAFVIYESPYRVTKVLEDISSIAENARVVCGRELTKTFEEIRVRTAKELFDEYSGKDSIKGEFVLIVIPEGAVVDKHKENIDS